ncbi:MAG TPA: glycosyltransferase family 39 protein [Candidatus Thermoplasmatota archaeon]
MRFEGPAPFLGTWLRIERVAAGVVLLGIAIRATALLGTHVPADACTYAVMADTLLRTGEFLLPSGEWFAESWAPGYSHHFGPGYPVFLAPFVALGGLNPTSILAGAFVSGLLLIATVFLATRHLYGARKAWLAAALAAVDPILVESARAGYSENFLALLFVATVWAILTSLRDGRLIVLAGLFAGMAYMTKGVMGWFFLIAGFAGLAWRLHFMGPRVLRDRYYLAAILVFGAFVAVWSARNIGHFWDGDPAGLLSAWQSSEYLHLAETTAAAHPGDLAFVMGARAPFFAGLFLLAGGMWLNRLRRLPKLSDEHYSGLWLAVGLTYLLSWIITGVLWTLERSDLFWTDPARYVAVASPIIAWLVLRDADIDTRDFRRRFVAAVALALVVLLVIVSVPRPYAFDAYDALEERAPPGSVIAVDTLNRYEVLVNVGGPYTFVKFAPNTTAGFIVTSDLGLQPPSYTRIYVPGDGRVAPGPTFGVAVWARD